MINSRRRDLHCFSNTNNPPACRRLHTAGHCGCHDYTLFTGDTANLLGVYGRHTNRLMVRRFWFPLLMNLKLWWFLQFGLWVECPLHIGTIPTHYASLSIAERAWTGTSRNCDSITHCYSKASCVRSKKQWGRCRCHWQLAISFLFSLPGVTLGRHSISSRRPCFNSAPTRYIPG